MKKFVVMMVLAVTALFRVSGETYIGGYTYAGVMTMYSSDAGKMVPFGLATVKVAKVTTKKTCKVTMQIQKGNQAKYTISGTLNLKQDASGLSGSISAKGKGTWESEQIDTAHFEMFDPNTGIYIQARRNYLEGVDAKKWSGKLSPFVGVWNAYFYTEDLGTCLLNCVVNNKGIVKIKTYGWHVTRSSYAAICTTKLVSEASESKCEIPIHFQKLTDKKNISASLNVVLTRNLRQGTFSMKMDSSYGCYAIKTVEAIRQGSAEDEMDELLGFEGGKGTSRPVGDYIVHGGNGMNSRTPEFDDDDMFGLTLLATLGYPWYGTSLKVTRLGWVTPKAAKITSSTTLPLAAANPSGIKLTNNKKTHTFKGSYNTYVVGLNKRIKKCPAKVNGVSWRGGYTGQLTDYCSMGYAFIKGPNGQIEYDFVQIVPPNSEDEDEGDE